MNRGRIIYASVLFSVFAAFGAVYQFYFKARLEAYRKDELFAIELQGTLDGLADTFKETTPDELTRAWRAQIQPWNDAVTERAKFFNLGGWFEHEKPPAESLILKFWYDEQSQKELRKLYQKVGEKMGRYDLFPPDIRENLGIPVLDDWANIDVTERDVNRELARLNFGIKTCELLLDAKVSSLNDVVMWQTAYQSPAYNKLLNLQTTGMSFTITMKNLVALLEEKFRLANRYFTVNGLRITYPYIAINAEPELQVEMLVTQAEFVNQQEGGNLRQAFDQNVAPRTAPTTAAPAPSAVPTGFFGKAWKWIKVNIFVTNA